MDYPLLQIAKVTKCTSARAAGTANSTGSMIDTAGYDSNLFLASLGAVTNASVVTLSAKGGNSTTSTAATTLTPAATITETTADIAENGVLGLELVNAGYRYVWPILTIANANCALDNLLCIQSPGKSLPVSQSTSIVASTWAFGAST